MRIHILLLLLFCAGDAFAQTKTVSLSSGGFPTVSGESPGTPLSSQSMIGEPLYADLNFGDVSPSAYGARRVVIKTPVRISAKRNYKVEIQRLSDVAGGVSPSEIGFGVVNVRLQTPGDPKTTPDAANIAIVGNFASNPAQAPIQNGIPQFQSTLANVGETPTLLFTGVPTAKGGGHLDKDDGSILIDFVFVMDAQYYNAITMSNITVTITEF